MLSRNFTSASASGLRTVWRSRSTSVHIIREPAVGSSTYCVYHQLMESLHLVVAAWRVGRLVHFLVQIDDGLQEALLLLPAC